MSTFEAVYNYIIHKEFVWDLERSNLESCPLTSDLCTTELSINIKLQGGNIVFAHILYGMYKNINCVFIYLFIYQGQHASMNLTFTELKPLKMSYKCLCFKSIPTLKKA